MSLRWSSKMCTFLLHFTLRLIIYCVLSLNYLNLFYYYYYIMYCVCVYLHKCIYSFFVITFETGNGKVKISNVTFIEMVSHSDAVFFGNSFTLSLKKTLKVQGPVCFCPHTYSVKGPHTYSSTF